MGWGFIYRGWKYFGGQWLYNTTKILERLTDFMCSDGENLRRLCYRKFNLFSKGKLEKME